MNYYSVVVTIDPDSCYYGPRHGYFAWVMEFVKPIIAEGLHEKYWFGYYGDHAKLRIWTDEERFAKLKPVIDGLI